MSKKKRQSIKTEIGGEAMAEDQAMCARVPKDVIEAGHRVGCDRAMDKFYGTESEEEKKPVSVYRCSCGLAEQRVDVATGEILAEKMA